MRYFSYIFFTFLLFSCGPAALVDYEKGVSWDTEKTYAYYSEMNSGLSEKDIIRVEKTVDSLMQVKGFTKVDTANHYFVSYFAEEVVGESQTSLGLGMGSAGVGGSVGVPLGANRVLQRLTVEIRDATKDQKLLWQCIHEGHYREKASDKRKDQYYTTCVSQMLETFPPEQ